jgi:putative tryptophan/tyrosine transport system substrate-binding protein
MRRVGVLLVGWPASDPVVKGLSQGLREAGYQEGRDVAIEWRSANGDYDQVPRLAADLVQQKVDVLVADGTVATRALKTQTSTIPIVMALAADPVGSGLVASLAQPGGNVTGLSLMLPDLASKQLQLLKEALPDTTRVAVLWNPRTPFHATTVKNIKAAAPSLSIEPQFVEVRSADEFRQAFVAIRREHAHAVFVLSDPTFSSHRASLLELASKARLPVVGGERDWPDAGGLMSYSPSFADMFHRAASYVDKIFNGARPADLPVERPTKFELVVNFRRAKQLGLAIPQSFLRRADEVIR